mmetsp:Transcript_57549/g.160234  ORF Transcript_57549/g.160234 Transcript_57549/m.160234 type:complete len:209 (-) Transcript_57549:6-632(-)
MATTQMLVAQPPMLPVCPSSVLRTSPLRRWSAASSARRVRCCSRRLTRSSCPCRRRMPRRMSPTPTPCCGYFLSAAVRSRSATGDCRWNLPRPRTNGGASRGGGFGRSARTVAQGRRSRGVRAQQHRLLGQQRRLANTALAGSTGAVAVYNQRKVHIHSPLDASHNICIGRRARRRDCVADAGDLMLRVSFARCTRLVLRTQCRRRRV